MYGYTAWEGKTARSVIDEKKAVPGALLRVLPALQETFGYTDLGAKPLIADALNISCADVLGIVTFDSDFRLTPPAQDRCA